MEKVSVIIPNWNGQRFLKTCLDSLRMQNYRHFTIYLVDNGSTDDSLQFVRDHYPEVKLIALPQNLGFSAAINAGIRQSSGELVVALNNDTETDSVWLHELIKIMDVRSDIDFCASLVLDFKARHIIDSFGDNYSFIGISGKIGEGKDSRNLDPEPMEIFSACAAASLYRRSMLDQIGLFDEDFFCYMEDIDLGIRAQLAGFRGLAIPTARVYHIGSATTGGDMSPFSLSMTAKNIVNILLKDIPWPLLILMLPLSLGAQLWLVLESLFTSRRPKFRKNIKAYFQGLAQGIKLAPVMLHKRRSVQRARKLSVVKFAMKIYQSRVQYLGFRRLP